MTCSSMYALSQTLSLLQSTHISSRRDLKRKGKQAWRSRSTCCLLNLQTTLTYRLDLLRGKPGKEAHRLNSGEGVEVRLSRNLEWCRTLLAEDPVLMVAIVMTATATATAVKALSLVRRR